MNKKIALTVAAAATLLMTNPGANKADAASNCPTPQSSKTVTFQSSNISQAEINSLVSKYFPNFKFQNAQNTQMNQKAAPAPAQASKPAPAAAPAPAQASKPAPAPAAKPAPAANPAPAAASGEVSAFEQKVVELTNQERAKQGLSALKLDTDLSKVAGEKSKDMKVKGYFDHNSPTYGSPFDMMKQFGISYSSAGENIAMGQSSPEEVVQAWMNSEGHRKNIMNPSFTNIGVGHVAEGNYWTQMFIGK